MDAELVALYEQLLYVGFSTQEFRSTLVKNGWTAEEILRAITVYLAMGNNPFQEKRKQKARDPKKAEEVAGWLGGKQVKKGAAEGNPVTLGRVAKAYAPVVLAMRKSLGPKLRVQIATSSPVEQCDVAFLGYDGTKQCANSRDFCENFGVVLTKANPAYAKLNDDDIRKRNTGFASIARSGLDADKALKDLLNLETLPDIASMMKALHKPVAPTHPPATGAATTAKVEPPVTKT
jgi:hypothetical protein